MYNYPFNGKIANKLHSKSSTAEFNGYQMYFLKTVDNPIRNLCFQGELSAVSLVSYLDFKWLMSHKTPTDPISPDPTKCKVLF